MTTYVEQLERRTRRARWIRNVYLVAALAVPALLGSVFVQQDRFAAMQLAQEKTVIAEVVIADPGSAEPHALAVEYEIAGKVQRALLIEPGLPNRLGARFPVRARIDTGTLVTTPPPTPDEEPSWQTRAIPLLCGSLPFAVLSFGYESRRRSLARNLRLRAEAEAAAQAGP